MIIILLLLVLPVVAMLYVVYLFCKGIAILLGTLIKVLFHKQ